jgi:integrase/recombinase XerD
MIPPTRARHGGFTGLVSEVGRSRRDVQQLAGHTSLAMTQRDIEGNTEAKRKLIELI